VTRRLTLTMVAVVTGALLVATVGTLIVTRTEARAQVRRELGLQAERLARRIETVQRVGLAAVQVALRLEDGAVVCLGQTCGPRPMVVPRGLDVDDLDPERLRQGDVVTGTRGDLVFAAAPADRGESLMAVVLTRRVDTSAGVLGPWFFALIALTLLAAIVVAADLGRRLTRPLRDAQAVTGRIASGDLAARVPENPADGDELAALARSINTMAQGLERSRKLERQFLLSVSHDLRTPLTSIRGVRRSAVRGQSARPGQGGDDHRGRGPPARTAGRRPPGAGQARRPPLLPRRTVDRRGRGGRRYSRGVPSCGRGGRSRPRRVL
jgi:HAMP domain-containing protein